MSARTPIAMGCLYDIPSSNNIIIIQKRSFERVKGGDYLQTKPLRDVRAIARCLFIRRETFVPEA